MKLPPHDYDAERALLGSLMCAGALGDPGMEIIGEAREIVSSPDQFLLPFHRSLFAAICAVVDENGALDDVQLATKLRAMKSYDIDKLVDVCESVPVAISGGHARRCDTTVAAMHQRRRLVSAGEGLIENASDLSVPIADAVATVAAKVGEAEDQEGRKVAATKEEAMGMLTAKITFEQTDTHAVPSGFSTLDIYMRRLRPGLHILAARPSVGKSALALNIADNAARAGHGVALFSMEMDHEEIATRLLSQHLNIDSNVLMTWSTSEVRKRAAELHQAVEHSKGTPLYIEDSADLSINLLKTKAKRYVQTKEVRLIVIDYLGLMRLPKSESRNTALGELTRAMKVMTKELQIPILCLHQLSRPQKGQVVRRPTMEDLRESGHIEQDADSVLLLHRTSSIDAGDIATVELLIEKQRGGRRGIIDLHYHGPTTRFYEPTNPNVMEGI